MAKPSSDADNLRGDSSAFTPFPQLPGFEIQKKLTDEAETVIYAGMRLHDRQPVILKMLKPAFADQIGINQYQNECRLTRDLSAPNIVKVFGMEFYEGAFFLVIEDFNGMPLTEWMVKRRPAGSKPMPLPDFFKLADQIVDGLIAIHAAGVIHKDLRPYSIILNPDTGEAKIGNFDLASSIGQEISNLVNPWLLEGILAYLSPEQTGRMNRAIDHRTDFYSLGATFYELLTGRPPFESSDAMELIHAHLAKTPAAIDRLNPLIPEVVSRLVLKMMAKEPEDRYQSARGLRQDLQMCSQLLQIHGTVPAFELGHWDRSDYFLIPQKLYGRSKELNELLQSYERAARGQSELILIRGLAGIGKTALVNEIHEPIVRKHGYFIKGKFDPFKHNIPFSAFVEALRDLLKQLIFEDPNAQGLWKTRILSALGSNGKILIDVIPELEKIIGPQPPVPELSGNAAQNRFYILFLKLIEVLLTPDRPLAIFLDDLQWADLPSLKLIQELVSPGNSRFLFLIGTYRESDSSTSHGLNLALAEISKSASTVKTIVLGPLLMSDVNQLIADALRCSPQMAIPLASLIYRVTQGNPFFNNQFLKSLYEEGLIRFNQESGFWQCDIYKVRDLSMTDDVLEFLAGRLQKLPVLTQEALKLAACLGNSFDLETLSIAGQIASIEIADALWIALQSGIILAQSEAPKLFPGKSNVTDTLIEPEIKVPWYGFLHDRVRQAAYSLIPVQQRQKTHLRIARLLLLSTPEKNYKTKIFEIVNQFNQAADLITAPNERQKLAELNLFAGQKAKASVAYRAAWDYFVVARQMLPKDCWHNQYAFTLNLYESSIEAAYLSGDFEALEELLRVVYQEIKEPLDLIKIFVVQCQAMAAQGKFRESINIGFQILNDLGIVYPRNPDQNDIDRALQDVKSAYADKKVEELLELPLMTDPRWLAATWILASLGFAAFHTAPDLFAFLALQHVCLSIRHGNTPSSAFGYATYGQILCREAGGAANIELGYRFGQLGLDLVTRMNEKELMCRTHAVVHSFVLHWKDPLSKMLGPLRSAYVEGLDNGDFQFGAFSGFLYCAFSYFGGITRKLSELKQEIWPLSVSLRQIKQTLVYQYLQMMQQAVQDLESGLPEPEFLRGEYYDEKVMRPIHQRMNDWFALFYIDFHKLVRCYFFGAYAKAVEASERLKQYIKSMQDFPYLPILCLYDSLARLALHREHPGNMGEVRLAVEENQARMKIWAHHAPMNYLHKYHLMEAELYREVGDKAKALDAYDSAIEEAKNSGYFREEALANELAATFFLDWDKEKIAQAYMKEAHNLYARWGANAKAAQLEKRYGKLPASLSERHETASSGFRSNGSGEASGRAMETPLDLATVVKASQAIAREIELEPLLVQLMRIVIENAGAQRGALILEQNGEWVIEALADVDAGNMPLLQSKSLKTSGIVSAEIVSRVQATLKSVVLDDAAVSGDFTRDPYIKQRGVRSVICAPLINQAKLSGIVYLENNLTTHAFAKERLELLNLLSTQMALSLDNARLYQKAQAEIAERKQAEIALRDSEQRFRMIFDSVNDAIIVHDSITGQILDANATTMAMYGFTREELLHMMVEQLRENEGSFIYEEAFGFVKKLEEEGPQIFEWKAKNKKGRIFWVELNMRLANIEGCRRTLVSVRDIGERKRIEGALQRSESVLKATIESISDGLLIISESRKVLYSNERFFEIGSIPENLRSATEDHVLLAYILQQLKEPEVFNPRIVEICQAKVYSKDLIHFKDGRVFLRFAYPLENAGGEFAWVWLFRDITERVQAMERIRGMNEELEQRVLERTSELENANKELEAFSYSVSHDLRAPLRAIDGYTRILREDFAPSLDAEGVRLFSIVQSQTQHMGRLIDDLLAFSRLSRTGMKAVLIDMTALASSVFQVLTTPEERGRIDFRVASLPSIIGDPTLLHQAWRNLIGNAIKFSGAMPRAMIEIKAIQKDNEAVYFVSDNGAGFDMQYADKLFGIFQRLHRESEFKGNGVGLAIVQRVIRRHGGRVWAESEVGKGSTFYFSLPCRGER